MSPLDRTDANAQESEPMQICAAFPLPTGIPDEIWWNRADHRQPYAGDQGIRWEAKPSAKFPEWAMAKT